LTGDETEIIYTKKSKFKYPEKLKNTLKKICKMFSLKDMKKKPVIVDYC